MKPYLIVTDGPCALSIESSERELVYTSDPNLVLAYSTRSLAEASPWFCLGDTAMRIDEFVALLQRA